MRNQFLTKYTCNVLNIRFQIVVGKVLDIFAISIVTAIATALALRTIQNVITTTNTI